MAESCVAFVASPMITIRIFAEPLVRASGGARSAKSLTQRFINHPAIQSRKPKQPSGAAMDERLMLRIRERAYEIWAASGGNAEGNWLRAEAELMKNSNCEPISSPVKKTRRAKARTGLNGSVAHR